MAEQLFFELEQPAEQAAFAAFVRERAEEWARNFEHGGGAEEDPYTEGTDLWIDLVERWPEDFWYPEAVSNQEIADQIGEKVCAEVVEELGKSRRPEEEE